MPPRRIGSRQSRGWIALGIQSELGWGKNLLNLSKTVLAQSALKGAIEMARNSKWWIVSEMLYYGGLIGAFGGGTILVVVGAPPTYAGLWFLCSLFACTISGLIKRRLFRKPAA